MINATIFNLSSPPLLPSLPQPPPRLPLSPLLAILSLLVLIAIPAFLYAFFFAINWPPNTLRRFSRSADGVPDDVEFSEKGSRHLDLVAGVSFTKETHGKEHDSECPVCLSAFVEGDYVRHLNVCKHSFHAICIDKWLFSHPNCPVCRASVPVKRAKIPPPVAEVDLRLGLPDAASLV